MSVWGEAGVKALRHDGKVLEFLLRGEVQQVGCQPRQVSCPLELDVGVQ